MSYLFVSYIYTQFKVWGKVFGFQILFTGSWYQALVLGKRTEPGQLVVVRYLAKLLKNRRQLTFPKNKHYVTKNIHFINRLNITRK